MRRGLAVTTLTLLALVGLAALLGAYGTAAGKATEKRAAEIKG